ncbi:cell division protein ZapA [Phaeobacter sp. HF9A]|uniref:cell division protein ZapA n=1 Tax=Phaeobacter sp. HF9A TaxID=2721561 RepID=UPI00143102DA|nr:cell division protein ZapA [Phaeobacter sp. HF9A]NIZ13545.1 cell division protein ZapA [Phaeobacter sp. HF9A]
MPEVTIHIGGRDFVVSCQEGEQSFLHMAAGMLDEEAQVLSDQIGRMPEARMLLMAGLMLADKTAAVEDRIKEVEAAMEEKLVAKEAELAEKIAELEELRSAPPPEPVQVEVPVVPPQVADTLTALAAQAEALASEIEAKAAPDEDDAAEEGAPEETPEPAEEV